MKSPKKISEGNLQSFWAKVFGIRKGDLIRFKWDKVIWEVYAVLHLGNFNGYKNAVLYKLKRKKIDSFETVYKSLWSFHIEFQEVRKVGKKGHGKS